MRSHRAFVCNTLNAPPLVTRIRRAVRQESGLLPACARVHEQFQLEPIWTGEVPNHGNPPHQELGYYGDDSTFDVGLWRVIGVQASGPSR